MKVNLHQKTTTKPQLEFWKSSEKYRAFIGGIGSGKTYAGVIEIFKQQPGTRGAVISPTYNMLKKSPVRTFEDLARKAKIIKSFNKSELTAELINGVKIDFMTADNPERLRGLNLNWFWIDEAALVNYETWLIMLGRLRLAPMNAWITTTPRGFNWVYDVFGKEKKEDHVCIHSATDENVFLPESYIKSVRSQYTSHFAKQELEGAFIDVNNSMVKRNWWQYYKQPPVFKRLIWSWDTAFEKTNYSDYSVGQLWGQAENGYYLIEQIRGKYEFPELKQIVKNSFAKSQGHSIIIEKKASGHSLLQELRRGTSLPLLEVKVNKDKVSRVNEIAAYIESGRVYLPEGKDFILDFVEECAIFPNGKNDDQVDAMTQAIKHLTQVNNYQIGFL